MATNNDYPSYLPDDFKGLPSVPDGNRRIYFRPQQDGSNILVGEIISKSKIIIRYPSGSTIDIIPPDSVGSEEIKNGSIELKDFSDEANSQIMNVSDRVTQADLDNFNV